MKGKPKKGPREKDLTGRYMSGDLDEDRVDSSERFKARNKRLQQDKIVRTTRMRAEEDAAAIDPETLPIGEVVQVFSLFSEVEHEGRTIRCVVRKTLTKTRDTHLVVGDRVRFREPTLIEQPVPPATGEGQAGAEGKAGAIASPALTEIEPTGVIEQILPRRTVLTRAESFKGLTQHPIVANADQMLIVASIRKPFVRWGLVDRMIVAARSGGLEPVVCLNKGDLAPELLEPGPVVPASRDGVDIAVSAPAAPPDVEMARAAIACYTAQDIRCFVTSVDRQVGLDALRKVLAGKVTVLAGHSGVGKSSLVRAIQPQLDIRVGAISGWSDKGRHTTSSARRYLLDLPGGGAVIDTPGVKLFGLWGVTRANLANFFPDIEAGTAPEWRQESYERIAESLPEDENDAVGRR